MQVVLRAYEEACETCVNRYDGYVFRVLGDGIVAFFGFPLAHESEAERAVRAGLDIIDAIARLALQGAGRLQVRIGITSGMVVIASGERNAVPVKRSILPPAFETDRQTPGSVVVSESVRRMAGGEFEYEDLGEKELKGVSGLTKVYRVLDVGRAESRFEAATQLRLTPIVGRNTEISTLVNSWRQVLETRTGRAVLLRGEAGIGKSRTASALRERTRDDSGLSHVFQCSPFFINSPFYPIRTYFERALRLARDSDVGAKLHRLEARLIDNDLASPDVTCI